MQIQRLKAEREAIINEVKFHMGLDVGDLTKDRLIGSYVDRIGQAIINFINRDIPDELSYVWVDMVASALTEEQSGVLFPPVESEAVYEIKIGDTSIKPAGSVKQASGSPSTKIIESVVNDYTQQLVTFRRLRW
ncbi:hypothetical protein ACINKY_21385 [Paenibacillus illinoisensis]|uniref:Uncharacterized protein n=1 Tax=Paenibacillus illinoisensis TaxID=59845 RepID=A0ABW8HYI4_9BACL